MSQFFTSGGQSIGVSASASVLPMNIQDWFPLGWTGWISLLSKALSRVFSNTTVQKHHFFGAQLSLYSNSHICTWLLEIMALTGSYLEDLTGSPVMALSITWGCRPVLWQLRLSQWNVSLRARAHSSQGGDSGFVTSRGGQSALYLWYLVEVSPVQTWPQQYHRRGAGQDCLGHTGCVGEEGMVRPPQDACCLAVCPCPARAVPVAPAPYSHDSPS